MPAMAMGPRSACVGTIDAGLRVFAPFAQRWTGRLFHRVTDYGDVVGLQEDFKRPGLLADDLFKVRLMGRGQHDATTVKRPAAAEALEELPIVVIGQGDVPDDDSRIFA